MKKMNKALLLVLAYITCLAEISADSIIVDTAKSANWIAVEAMVANGIDVNSSLPDGTSALHWASYRNNAEIARVLIEAGANANATTDIGATPLWLAAENGNVELVQFLLDAGADPNATLLSGESAVMVAALAGSEAVADTLLSAGADPNVSVVRGQTALMWAAGRGHSAVVRALLEHGADVNPRTETQSLPMKTDKEQYGHPDFKNEFETGGNNALIFAARSGDLDSVTYLVNAGSDVNATSASGESPVVMATHSGNAKIVELLAQRGANLDSTDAGYTALHAAVLRRNLDVLEVLLANGASPNAKVRKATPTRRQSIDFNFHETFVGATALWLAARFSEPEMMRSLIAHGADPHFIHIVQYPGGGDGVPFSMVEEGQVSVLMAAVGMGNRRLDRTSRMGRSERDYLDKSAIEELVLESVKIAIDAGVDPNLKDASERTALDTARSLRYTNVVALLSGQMDQQALNILNK